jgi:hypothetical protein
LANVLQKRVNYCWQVTSESAPLARVKNALSPFAKPFGTLCGLAALVLGTGCANQVHLSRADYSSLHSVSVAKHLGQVHSVYYVSNYGAESEYGNDEAQLRAALADPMVNPARVVGESFESHIRRSGLFSKVKANGDATFVFQVKSAGLGTPHGFTVRVEPELTVYAQLISKDGKVLWARTERVAPGEHPGASIQGAYVAHNHAALRSLFESAADTLAKKWIADIKSDLTPKKG